MEKIEDCQFSHKNFLLISKKFIKKNSKIIEDEILKTQKLKITLE